VTANFNIIISSFRDFFRRIGTTPRSWRVGFPHSPASAQITVSSAKLCLSLSEVHWFRVLRLRCVSSLAVCIVIRTICSPINASLMLFHVYVAGNLYGSHTFVFFTKQTTFIQLNTMHVCCNSVGYLYMHATSFGLYFRPSSSTSMQKPYKGRHNKNLRGPFVSRYFCNVETEFTI
jgi:hypothetical protein